MRKQALTILLVALTIFSLSGCKKDKPEETTAPKLEVIAPEETEPEVLESAPVKGETLKIGDGKSLEELSEEAGLPVIAIREVEDEEESSTNSADGTKSDNETEKSNGSGESSSGAEGNTSEGKSNTEENKPSESNEQSNNGGDTEVVGIDQEVFNEMQNKYEAEADEVLNDPEQVQELIDIMNGGK